MIYALIVAANGYTRDHIAIACNGGRAVTYTFDGTGYRPQPLAMVDRITTERGTVRFVTDNDLDDGVFRVVGEE